MSNLPTDSQHLPIAPQRVVHIGDAVRWLSTATLDPTSAVVTSMPDLIEMPGLTADEWRAWFIATSALICSRLDDNSVAIFFQTDVKRDGVWVDKGYLVMRGAEEAGSALLWHKVVCRAPAGITTFGRPAYAHMLCFSRKLRLTPGQSSADVLPTLGEMTWPRAMGVDACIHAATFLRNYTDCKTIVDPFCGVGTMLAVGNQMGFDTVGVELSRKRAKLAMELQIDRRHMR